MREKNKEIKKIIHVQRTTIFDMDTMLEMRKYEQNTTFDRLDEIGTTNRTVDRLATF